ncbi:hypothetical protein D3C78_1761020 [compost metagenome]
MVGILEYRPASSPITLLSLQGYPRLVHYRIGSGVFQAVGELAQAGIQSLSGDDGAGCGCYQKGKRCRNGKCCQQFDQSEAVGAHV